jgi:ketosteroid isomerase-like protein
VPIRVPDDKEVPVKRRFLVATLWLALVATGCAGSSLESYKPKGSDEEIIVATLMKIPRGIKAKSVEVLMQAYADDLYVGNFNRFLGVATDTSAVRIGKPELRQAYSQVFRSAGVKEMSMDVKDFRLSVQGDRAVAEAYTELLVKVEAGRKEAREELVRNEVTWRLKRGPLGWRVQEEIFH